MNNAEILFGVTLAQLVRPGAPVLYGNAAKNVDLKTCAPAYGLAESYRFTHIGGQLARRYRMPLRSSAFCASNLPDAAAMLEGVGAIWAAITAGANLLMHGAGWLEGGLCSSFEKFVLDVEVLQNMAVWLEPVTIDAETLALDEIAEVGPGGHFFGTARTIATFETAFHRPSSPPPRTMVPSSKPAGSMPPAVRTASTGRRSPNMSRRLLPMIFARRSMHLLRAAPVKVAHRSIDAGSSAAHARALRIEQRRPLRPGGSPAADDLDREAAILLRKLARHIAHRQRLVGPMGVAARRHPADHLAIMPDRLIAQHIGVLGIDHHGQPPKCPALLPLDHRRPLADEVLLVEVDEASDIGFIGP